MKPYLLFLFSTLIALSLMPLSVCGFDTNVFTWPASISNFGPYTLISPIQNSVVMTPNSNAPAELEPLSHRYHHHVVLARAGWMTFLASTSAGQHEDQDGVQCHVFVSTNNGITWGAPVVAVPSQTTWSTNIYSTWRRIPYPRNATFYNGTNYLTFAVDQFTDAGIVGAALLSCSLGADGNIGTLFRISTAAYDPTNGYPVPVYDSTIGPALLADSKLYGKWGGSYAPVDNSAPWGAWLQTNSNTFLEPSTVSADGSSSNFYRIWRVLGGYTGGVTITNLAVNRSSDAGATWTEPIPTTVPNEPSETAVLRLSTGQFAFIGNARKYTGCATLERDPLFLGITGPNSVAITNVWAIRQNMGCFPIWPGNSKQGGAQYPGAIQVGNYIYTGYSVHKEWLGFSRVLIPGLADNNNDGPTNPIVALSVGSLNIRQ